LCHAIGAVLAVVDLRTLSCQNAITPERYYVIVEKPARPQDAFVTHPERFHAFSILLFSLEINPFNV
jgi:hypothetical protein